MKKILLVEDEFHKKEELTTCLEEFFKNTALLEHVDSVHAAVWALASAEFDLIVLDMALPTFSTDGSTTERGHDQALGGVEVLRALKSRGVSSKVIIITQYPEITVGGKRLKLGVAPEILSKRYNQNVVGGVLYKYKSPTNNVKLTNLLKKAT
jgi:CheY-like chemotaxis protein